MRSIAEERDSAVVAYPPRKGVSVYEFPVDDRGSLFHDCFADWVPAFDYFVYVFELSGE